MEIANYVQVFDLWASSSTQENLTGCAVCGIVLSVAFFCLFVHWLGLRRMPGLPLGRPAPSQRLPMERERCSRSETRQCGSACGYLLEEPRSAFASLTNTAPHPC